MTNQVAISVVLPAFNEEKLIGRCLESLTNQDFSLPYEIIMVNNNSTDQTETIAKSFTQVKLITEVVQGVVQARQRGLIEAQADIVVSADCDCVYPPMWLTNLYRHFADSLVVAAGGPAIAETNPWWAHLIYKWGYRLVAFIYKKLGKVIYLGGYNFAFSKNVFLKSGGYKTYLDFGGDELEPLARLKKMGKVVFDIQAYIYVSTRRYRVGFIKWFFVHNLYYYFLNYALAKVFKKQIIKAKAVRNI